MSSVSKIISIVFLAALPTVSKSATNKFPITVKTNPFELAKRNYMGQVDVGVAEQISVGISGEYLPSLKVAKATPRGERLELNGNANSIGLNATIYSNGVKNSGLYASSTLGVSSLKGTQTIKKDNDIKIEKISASYATERYLAGYQWKADIGISAQVGAGFQKTHIATANGKTSSNIMPSIELNLGYSI